MAKEPTDVAVDVVPEPQKTPVYTGQEIQKVNTKMAKLAPQIRAIIAMETREPIDITKTLYPEWETMTKKDFEGKEWYVTEKLIPLLDRDSADVYNEMLEEERIKGLTKDEAVEQLSW